MSSLSNSKGRVGIGLAIAALAGYICWDISRPLLRKSRSQGAVAQLAARTTRDADQSHETRTPRSMGADERAIRRSVPPTTSEESGATDPREAKRQEAIRRADQRTETLRQFHSTQPRNAWAQETEIAFQRAPLPEGVTFREVSCKADICRIVASGKDRYAIFDAVSGVQEERKTFSRQISESDGVAIVETFVSPNDSDWPNPFSKEGG
jgi:hypothetical protein